LGAYETNPLATAIGDVFSLRKHVGRRYVSPSNYFFFAGKRQLDNDHARDPVGEKAQGHIEE
jgi:hypothetical protein